MCRLSAAVLLVLAAICMGWVTVGRIAAADPDPENKKVPSQRRPQPQPADLEVMENSIGMKLIRIPAGEFDLGSPEDEADRHSDETLVHVRLSQDFFIGQTEVTVGQFRQFVNDSGYRTDAETDGQGGEGFNATSGEYDGPDLDYNWRNAGGRQTDDHPVVNVSWNDAQEFLKWLSEKEKIEYRLPTEAEWEYACRAGTRTRFSTGDDETSLEGVANVDGPWGDPFPFTAPVGSFKPNAFNLFDMHGNVWEYCQDTWSQREPSGPLTDPVWLDGSHHVARGGSCYNTVLGQVRSAYRTFDLPGDTIHAVGFRAVATADRP